MKKICTKCEKEKDVEEFSFRTNGYKMYPRVYCKKCSANIIYLKRLDNNYRKRDLENNKKYRLLNKDKWANKSQKYKAKKLNQTPANIDMSKIQEIYSICAQMNSISINCKWHIDHIHPLSKGGLHHQDNLQILDSVANIKKGNKILGRIV